MDFLRYDICLNYVTNQQTYIGSKLIMEEIPLVQLIYTGKALNNDLVNIVPLIHF